VHIITYKRIREFVANYPDSQSSLESWYQIVRHTNYESWSHLKQHFSSADYVSGFVVFNIRGNKYRMITTIHFNRMKVYVRAILAHSEHDKDQWKR